MPLLWRLHYYHLLDRIALRVPTIYTSEFHLPPTVIFGWLHKHS